MFYSESLCLTASSIFTLCCFHAITVCILHQMLKMLPLCHWKQSKCLRVSIFLSAFWRPKCQTWIKDTKKLVKHVGSQIKPAKTFGVLLGKDVPWSRVSKEDSRQHKEAKRRNHLKVRRCGPPSHPLATVSRNQQQPPPLTNNTSEQRGGTDWNHQQNQSSTVYSKGSWLPSKIGAFYISARMVPKPERPAVPS